MALQHDVNRTPLTGDAALLQYFAVLILGGWTVHAWGNSVLVTRDGSLPSLVDLAVPTAWVAMVRPTSTNTMVFQRGADSTLWWVAMSLTGLTTDGTGSVVDSAADIQDVHGTSGAPTQLFAADGIYRANAIAFDTDARSVLLCWCITTGERYTEISTDPLEGLHPSDTCTWSLRAAYATNAVSRSDNRAGTPSKTWRGKGGGSPVWDSSVLAAHNLIGLTQAAPSALQLSPYDAQYEIVRPEVYCYNVGFLRWKGYSTLIRWAGTGVPVFNTLNTGGAFDWIALDDVLFPWPSGVSPLV